MVKRYPIALSWILFSVSVGSGMSLVRHDPELQLVALDSVCTVDEVTGRSGVLPLRVLLRNSSRQDILVVVPVEGSHQGLQLPYIGWSVLADDSGQHPLDLPLDSSLRLGTIHAGKSVWGYISAGKSLQLQDWIEIPSELLPGTYRIVFYYQNIQTSYSGYRNEYRGSLRSNEVRIRVVEKR